MTTNDSWGRTDLLPAGALPSIPDVTLLHELARGGMGIVYRGRQEFLERDVAVKLLSPELHGGSSASRFRREAKLLAGIKHPNIVACYSAGVTTAGQHYLVMELVEGPTLAQWIAQHGPAPLPAALRLVSQLAGALGHACELGVIHRDVKTANVLLEATTGTVLDARFAFVPKLVDLGLARLVAGSTDLARTSPGAVMGTPATMAPEQFDDPESVDFRADIYGLGCVLYELLTGSLAFPSQRLTELVVQKRCARGPNPCERSQSLPAAVGELVAAMLAQDPADRPPDYRTLRARLDALADDTADDAMNATTLPPRSTNVASARRATAGAPGSADVAPVPKAAPKEDLLRSAEFAFLAEGHDAKHGGGGSAFVSRITTPDTAGAADAVAPIAKPRIGVERSLVPLPANAANAANGANRLPAVRSAAPGRGAAGAVVVGARRAAPSEARNRTTPVIVAVSIGLLGVSAVPWLRAPAIDAPPPRSAPSSAAPNEPAAAVSSRTHHRPEVELLGLAGPLRRGENVRLESRVHDVDGDPLQYQWAVEPATAAVFDAPSAAATSLQHALLPGDTFTVRLTVTDPTDRAEITQRVVVQYEPDDLLADFFVPGGVWQPNGRTAPVWQQGDDGAVVVEAEDTVRFASRVLPGATWRVAGVMVPEGANVPPPDRAPLEQRGPEPREREPRGLPPRDDRRGPEPRPGMRGQGPRGPMGRGPEPRRPEPRGPESNERPLLDRAAARFAESAVAVRVAPDRQLALVCTRSGIDGERWSLSLQELLRDDGPNGFVLRPLPNTFGTSIETTGAYGATYTITRRGDEMNVQFGFIGRPERGEFHEALPGDRRDVALRLCARAGRVAFPRLVLW